VGRGESQSEFAYAELKEGILSGTISPGARLVEVQLANELGVSRTPVREALRRLMTEGFVSRHHTGGLVAHEPSAREIEEIYYIREVLDGLAAYLAAQRLTESELVRIELTAEAHRTAVARFVEHETTEAVAEMVAANIAFHDLLYEISGNERLMRMSREVRDSVRLFSREAFASAERDRDIVREHEAIIDALRKRDSDAAERAARAHLTNARTYLVRRLVTRASQPQ
jgi:DNA-binding GntR family transcriptional regulator